MGNRVFWKVYRKGVVRHIDKVFYPVTMDAEKVMSCIEGDYDFPVTISPDESD